MNSYQIVDDEGRLIGHFEIDDNGEPTEMLGLELKDITEEKIPGPYRKVNNIYKLISYK